MSSKKGVIKKGLYTDRIPKFGFGFDFIPVFLPVCIAKIQGKFFAKFQILKHDRYSEVVLGIVPQGTPKST